MEENKITTNGNLYIPNEVVFGILKRVHVKSLMRFRCISKYFCSLISEPLFIEAHGKNFAAQFLVSRVTLIQKEVIYNLSQREEYQDLACPIEYLYEPCFHNLHFMQSINGLVCLWNCDGDVAICNPFTKEHIFLPKVQPREKGFLSVITCSFGFDPTSKKHKVLMSYMISNEDWRLIAKYWIFTTGVDKSWREISSWTEIISMNNSVCIDGVIYLVDMFGDRIVAFSIVGNEKLIGIIRFSSFISMMKKSFECLPKIVEIKGQVAVILDDKKLHGNGKILVCILNGTSETWTWLEHIVELPSELIMKSPCSIFTTNPKGEIVSILDNGISHMFLYDIGRQEWRKVEVHKIYEREYCTMNANSGLLNLVESIWSLR